MKQTIPRVGRNTESIERTRKASKLKNILTKDPFVPKILRDRMISGRKYKEKL